MNKQTYIHTDSDTHTHTFTILENINLGEAHIFSPSIHNKKQQFFPVPIGQSPVPHRFSNYMTGYCARL